MGYLVQKTRASQLLINGQDSTSSLISFQVSDSSAFKQGLITTSGTILLGQRPGGQSIEDYDRNIFKRGALVTLDLEEPGGSTYRHPRGHLYVITVAYNVEQEQLAVEVGCQIALAFLTDKADAIFPLVPIHLDPAQQTVQNCAASFASAGMVLYQDNQGNLQSRKFFEGDSTSGVAGGEWVSVLGQSTLSVSPLAANSAIPDQIDLSYQIPEGSLADDNQGKIDTTVETSNYFLSYPATIWKRNANPTPSGEAEGPAVPESSTPPPQQPPAGSTGCGNTPTPPNPGDAPPESTTVAYYTCNDLWSTDRATEYLPAVRVATSTTTYGAPGGQVSFREQIIEGPEIEANTSYFADKYAYCVATYGYACNPQGSCPYYGLDTKLLSRSTTTYEYGEEANELVRTIQDNYVTLLSAARTEDYRAGIRNGIPTGFKQLFSADMGMYRQSRVVTEYFKEDNSNIQVTTTFNSITSRGIGISSGVSIDAIDGIKTSVRRESTTTATLEVRPDTVNSATTSTVELVTELRLNTNSYVSPPDEAGRYVIDESIPVPLLSEDLDEIEGWVEDYSEYLVRFTKGDLYGLQIAESMRPEIVNNWYPGMPFRYADTANNRISAMRMDACEWGVTQEEAIVVTNGIWNGFSSGTLVIGDNLVGNSRPDMTRPTPGGGAPAPTPPTPPSTPPVIEDDVVGQSFEFTVNVNLSLGAIMSTYFEDGISKPNPTDLDALVEMTLVPYVTGFVVAAGGLLETNGSGSIPVEYNGSLITSDATIVDENLFAAAP